MGERSAHRADRRHARLRARSEISPGVPPPASLAERRLRPILRAPVCRPLPACCLPVACLLPCRGILLFQNVNDTIGLTRTSRCEGAALPESQEVLDGRGGATGWE